MITSKDELVNDQLKITNEEKEKYFEMCYYYFGKSAEYGIYESYPQPKNKI